MFTRIRLAALGALALLADLRRRDALAAQLGAQGFFVGCQAPALDARAALVATLPREGMSRLSVLTVLVAVAVAMSYFRGVTRR